MPACLFIVAWLGVVAWHLGRQIAGDPSPSPAAYFWTWDMYPNYRTESVRREILAETADGQTIRLLPDESDRFRWGNRGDATRFDLDQRSAVLERSIHSALSRRRQRTSGSQSPVVRIRVAEEFRPMRRNVESQDEAGPIPGAAKSSWRVSAEADVAADGSLTWKTGG